MADVRKDMEALQLALKTEQEGYQMFRQAAEQATNEFVKRLFMRLAKDELLHMDLIKRFYADLQNKNSWRDLSEAERDISEAQHEMKTIFSDALEKAKMGDLVFSDKDVEIYRKAAQFEKDGMDLYDKLYNETQDEKARRFYAFLREMEREHMEILDNTLQYLDNPDNWYLLTEGWSMED